VWGGGLFVNLKRIVGPAPADLNSIVGPVRRPTVVVTPSFRRTLLVHDLAGLVTDE
jgi:hypothetical protein